MMITLMMEWRSRFYHITVIIMIIIIIIIIISIIVIIITIIITIDTTGLPILQLLLGRFIPSTDILGTYTSTALVCVSCPNYHCYLRLHCDTQLLYYLNTGLAVLHPMKLTVYEVIPEGEKPVVYTTQRHLSYLYLSTCLSIYLPTYIYLGNKNGRVSYYSLRRAYSHDLGGVEGRHFTAYNMMTGSFGAGGVGLDSYA